jgi:predicted ATP-grasp superfamily ATP-dependent carboligase
LSRHFSFGDIVSRELLILGASARAAAFSAIQCGFHPRCADYFADRDLAEICPVHRIDPRHAVSEFVAYAESLKPMPWIYTGGLENHPDCVDHIASRHCLWGIKGPALRAVRDPHRVFDELTRRGMHCPKICADPANLPRDGSWLKKPLTSGGGWGIEPLSEQNDGAAPAHYFQERIQGPSFSALFIGTRVEPQAQLIGVTRQLIGISGAPFVYRGRIGPVPIENSLTSRLEALGNALASAFGLTGWFGVDFVLRDGIPLPVEINPRYTASVEIYERTQGCSLLPLHRFACDPKASSNEPLHRSDATMARVIAKWILYAPRRLVAPKITPEPNGLEHPLDGGIIADIPWPGSTIGPGEPIMTLITEGSDIAECWSRMIRLEQTWTKRL